VSSKLAGKGFSINDFSSRTIKSGTGNVASHGSSTASEPVRVQASTETEGMDDFVHNADHLSLVG